MQAIDVDTLRQHPTVIAALEAAWMDSLPDDPDGRHEEGGWIYQHEADGTIETRRATIGEVATINLDDPPIVSGAYVIATFHTHPHPSNEGWYTGPSPADIDSADYLGVPCIIRADDGLHTTGPLFRRGGLTGPAGYPL